jgi:hypothetical protein
MMNPTPDLVERIATAGHYRRTLQDYLGRRPVLSDEEQTARHQDAIDNAALFVSRGPGSMRCEPLVVPGLAGIEAFAIGGGFRNLLLHEGGAWVAGIFDKLPFVVAAHRGRGFGTLMVLISDLNEGRYLFPASYSQSGFRARRAAHRAHVRLAEIAGLEIPAPVRAQYRFDMSCPRLIAPWSPEAQTAWSAQPVPSRLATPDVETTAPELDW